MIVSQTFGEECVGTKTLYGCKGSREKSEKEELCRAAEQVESKLCAKFGEANPSVSLELFGMTLLGRLKNRAYELGRHGGRELSKSAGIVLLTSTLAGFFSRRRTRPKSVQALNLARERAEILTDLMLEARSKSIVLL